MPDVADAPGGEAPPRRMLVVDDDERFRERLAKALRQRGFEVAVADGLESALAAARELRPERATVDLRMPGAGGLAVLRALLAELPALEVVVLTGYGSIATAVEAVRLGARDYLTKPADADRVLAAFAADGADPEGEGAAEAPFETPSLARLEWEHIERVMRECKGNVSKAARVLGIHRRTLQYKLAKFPVDR
ncbi:MAG TPA: response regulator [Polyangiaceae bacterium]|nr:response regulator [Polyangiaceae bacterium]